MGAVGGLVYLRMLQKSLDSIGGGSPLGGALSNQRLLVPIILVMAFNRCDPSPAPQGRHAAAAS